VGEVDPQNSLQDEELQIIEEKNPFVFDATAQIKTVLVIAQFANNS